MKKLPSKKTRVPYLGITLTVSVLFALIYFTAAKLLKPIRVGINEVTASPATVSLTLPSVVQTQINAESSIDLMIDTGSSSVTAVQVELNYDPSSISTPTLTQGDFLTGRLGNPKIKDGTISFVYIIPIGTEAKSGTGKLATLSFKTLKSNSQISFAKNTMVAAIGSDLNVLKSATGTTVQTSGSSAPATPPVLRDIVVVPTPPASAPAKKTTTSTQATTVATPPAQRVFDETGNFKANSTNSPVSEENTKPTVFNQSAFARFLAWIKLFLGGKNAQN